MSDSSWTDRIVSERMTVDRDFSSQVADSRFSSQEWSLIMTATEFEIDHPDDPDRARLVANTDKIDQILPELENIRSQVGAVAGGGAGAGGTPSATSTDSGGLLGALKGVLGLTSSDGSSHDAEREAADRLTQEYADKLQTQLESNGRWESICAVAADAPTNADGNADAADDDPDQPA